MAVHSYSTQNEFKHTTSVLEETTVGSALPPAMNQLARWLQVLCERIVSPVDTRPGYQLQETGSKRNSFMRPAGEFGEQKSTFEFSQDTHHYMSISLLWDLACL